MKILFRWIARIVLGLLALATLAIAVLLAANWKDDALTPQAQALLAPPAPNASDAPNAHDVLLGMDAPENEDAMAAGRRLQESLDRQFRENPMRLYYDEPPRSAKILAATEAGHKLRCPLKGTDCAAFYLRDKTGLQRIFQEQSVLRLRYLQFSQIPVFDEPPIRSAAMPFPPYEVLAQAAELQLADAVFALDAGTLQTGADILAQEIRVHRHWLANSSILITKMVAAAQLRRDYQVLSDAIEHWPQLARQPALAEAWRPLDAAEYDMHPVLESEAIFDANMFHSLPQQQTESESATGCLPFASVACAMPWLSGHASNLFFLPNATVNEVAGNMAELAPLMRGNAATADTRHRAFAAIQKKWLYRTLPFTSWHSWRTIRNPVGKTLLAIGNCAIDFFAYAERVYDLDGYIRLAALQAALRREEIPRDRIAEYVRQAGPDLRAPYDGQPMRWDEADSTLFFEGRQPATSNPDDTPKMFRIHLAR